MIFCIYIAAKQSGTKQAPSGKVLKSGVSPDVGKATQFKPGQSGNPAGKPPGRISLSQHIQNMLNDDQFEALLPDPQEGFKLHKGRPVDAIIATAVIRAMHGEKESREWLAKYGYGTKVELTGPDGEGLFRSAELTVKVIDGRDHPQP